MKTKCPRQNCDNDAVVSPAYGILPCLQCQAKDQTNITKGRERTMPISKYDRIQRQRDAHEKDMIPPYLAEGKVNPDFAQAYPEEAEEYFDQGELEKL